MNRPSLTLLALAFVLIVFGCSKKDQPAISESHTQQSNSNPPESVRKFVMTSPVVTAVVAVDHSLNVEGYVELGMPAPDRTWYHTDYQQAMKVLQKIADEDPTKLPRFHGSNSGLVFDRVVSETNLFILTNSSLPLQTRIEAAVQYMQWMKPMLQIYALPMQKGLVFDDECVEVDRFSLCLMGSTLSLADQFLSELPAEDPSRERRTLGLNQMRDGAAQLVVGHLIMLSDRQNVRESARKRAAISMQKTLPVLIPHLPVLTQMDIRSQIKRLAQEEPNNEVKIELQSLADLLKGKDKP